MMPHMKGMKLRCAAAAAAAALCGCTFFLPEGDPPEGNIVNNSELAEIRSREDWQSRLVIRLTASAMMKNSFPEGLYITAPGELKDILQHIAADAAAVAGSFRQVSRPDGAWRLQGVIREDDTVTVTLSAPGAQQPEWQVSVSAALLRLP